MPSFEETAWITGIAFAAGLNVYATVALLGLLQRFGWVHLPPDLAVLSHPVVLGAAVVLYVVEFVADKVPYVDSVWDVIHTLIRPPAAALMAFGAFAGVPDNWRWVAALVAGSVALTSHGAKASTRAAVNLSPEPFSNSVLSLAEDAVAVALVWLANRHPVLTAVFVSLLLLLALYLILRFVRFLFRLLRPMFRQKTQPG